MTDSPPPGRRPWAAAVAVAGLVLLGLLLALDETRRAAGPAPGEATALGMAASLWHDLDLRFTAADLDRAFRVWGLGPRGVELAAGAEPGGTPTYAGSLAYPLAALPAYALFGPLGMPLFNAALYLALFAWGARMLMRQEGGRGLAAAAAFFFAAAAPLAAFRHGGEAWTMACVFVPLALLWWSADAVGGDRDRAGRWPWGVAWALAGVLAAAGALSEPLAALFAVPVGVELARRRSRSLLAFAAGALASAALLLGLAWALAGAPLQRSGPRAAFTERFPVGDETAAAWQAATEGPAEQVPGAEPPSRMGLAGLGWFLLGRHTGLVPYFPFALLALGVGLFDFLRRGARDRPHHLLLAAALYLLAAVLLPPRPDPGGLADQRLAVAYPALLFLLPGRCLRWSLAVPLAAAALWTVPALVQAVAAPAARHPPALSAHTTAPPTVQQGATFRPLPLELDLLAKAGLPAYAGRAWGGLWWMVPRSAFFVDEAHPNGVWVRGATTADLVVVAPVGVETLSLRAHSLAGAGNRLRLESGAGAVTVTFDSLAKQQGTLLTLPLSPAARAPWQGEAGAVTYTPLRLTVTGGKVAARHYPGSDDHRYLGVFLDFTGGGP